MSEKAAKPILDHCMTDWKNHAVKFQHENAGAAAEQVRKRIKWYALLLLFNGRAYFDYCDSKDLAQLWDSMAACERAEWVVAQLRSSADCTGECIQAHMSWRFLRKVRSTLHRAADAMVSERASIAFHVTRRHKQTFGTYPNLLQPKTFSERMARRMVFDRRPLLTQLADKYAVRDYVRERIGEHVLPRLYWVANNPADIPYYMEHRFDINEWPRSGCLLSPGGLIRTDGPR